jgi:hypothetical protein
MTAGNQAVQRLIKSRALQAKLRIGQPNDIYEQEADRVAEQVMRMPDPVLQRQKKPEEEKEEIVQTKSLVNYITPVVQRQVEEEEEEEQIQRKEASTIPFIQRVPLDPVGSFESGADFEAQLNTSGSGSPLPSRTRAFMEPRFGADFSEVRLHTGSKAEHLNRSISAQAFTQGRDIYLGEGRSNIESSTEKQLLAHELTHTVQQGSVNAYGSQAVERLSFSSRPVQRIKSRRRKEKTSAEQKADFVSNQVT